MDLETRVARYWRVQIPLGARIVALWRFAQQLGVEFTVTSGRRSEAQQKRLIRQRGVWSAKNPTGAARQSDHLTGRAFDAVTTREVANYGHRLSLVVIDEGDHFHFSWRY